MPARVSKHGAPGSALVFTDARGTLTLVGSEQIPFVPRRTYVLHQLPTGARRAGHANRTQRRLLVGLSGRSSVTLDDGRRSRSDLLGGGDTVLVDPGTWHQIETLDDQVAILVFADGDYDPGDFVEDRSTLPLAVSTARHTDAA